MNIVHFFQELINPIPLQHLIKYWLVWLFYILVLFSFALYLNKKV